MIMNQGKRATGLALLIAAAMFAGCATTGGKKVQPSIDQTLAGWKAAIESQNVEGMMAAYSADFKSDRGAGKAETQGAFVKARERGYFDEAKVDLSQAQTKIEQDAGTVGPIVLTSKMGSMSVNLSLKRDPDAVWRIVASEQLR